MAGNDLGNGLMSIGCLIMLIPLLIGLAVVFVAFVLTLLGLT